MKVGIGEAIKITGYPRNAILHAAKLGHLRSFKPTGIQGRTYFEVEDLKAWVVASERAAEESKES